jgi:hypothetical protein
MSDSGELSRRSYALGRAAIALLVFVAGGCSDKPKPARENPTASGGVGGAMGGTSATSSTTRGGADTGGVASGGGTAFGGSSALVTDTQAQGGAGGSGTDTTGRNDTSADTVTDAGDCTAFVMPDDCTIPAGAVLPGELRCTGLYADWQARTLRCGVQPYTPAYQLWSDGAGKQRYVWLPPGESIDVKNPDNFVFPVGTRFWKEFYVGPASNQRLGETRYLLKVNGGWLYTTYVWSADGTTAIQNNQGVEDLFGTGHTVPTRDQCKTCHSGRSDYILGWDFVMLGEGAGGITARVLADQGRLNHLDPALLELAIPGDAVERSALGYLHANCGVSCHNETTNATGKPSGLFLRLEVAEMHSVLSTDAARSGINRLPSPNADYGDIARPDAGDFYDFRPLDVERSLSIARMSYRGSVTGMPPIASHVVHAEGVAVVKTWVESMTEARGYPAAAP